MSDEKPPVKIPEPPKPHKPDEPPAGPSPVAQTVPFPPVGPSAT